MVELGKDWKKMRKMTTPQENHHSQLTWTPEISQILSHQSGSIEERVQGCYLCIADDWSGLSLRKQPNPWKTWGHRDCVGLVVLNFLGDKGEEEWNKELWGRIRRWTVTRRWFSCNKMKVIKEKINKKNQKTSIVSGTCFQTTGLIMPPLSLYFSSLAL